MNDFEVRVCKSCKKIFQTMTDAQLCNECKEALEKEFKRAKLYIRNNPGAGVKDVSEALKIPPKQILQWVREDRLYFAEDLKVQIPCMLCGVMIRSGKYCLKCETALTVNAGGKSKESVDKEKKTLSDKVNLKKKPNTKND